jgi:hypothetical protein
MIEPSHPRLSIVRQCELVSISRSSFYREPAPESAENLALMRLRHEPGPALDRLLQRRATALGPRRQDPDETYAIDMQQEKLAA